MMCVLNVYYSTVTQLKLTYDQIDQIDKQIRALYRELVLLLKQINDF